MSKADGYMPLLDTLVIPQPDGSLDTTDHRKATHTDQYIHWDCHHSIPAKYNVVNTLHHRARAVSSSPQLLQKEEEHIQKVLSRCMHPMWALNRMKINSRAQTIPVNNNTGTNTSTSTTSKNQRPLMVVHTPKA